MTAREIKRIRRKTEMTREQFARKIGVSLRTVEGWEIGRRPSRANEYILGIVAETAGEVPAILPREENYER